MIEPSQLFRKDVITATAYTVPYVADAIKLNQNECPWDLPIELKVAITERLIKTDFNRYPMENSIDLKKKFAKACGVLTDQIAVANGSNVLIQALVHATSLKPKGKVLVLDPTFSVYELQARLFGIPVVKVGLGENFTLPHEAVISAIKKEHPSLIFIANPNAPTGNLFAKEGLYRIVKAASCLTVIDEAYFPFSNETLIGWLGDFPHLLILRTLSKAFALAGVRVGFAISDTEIIAQLEKALLPFCLSRVAAAIAAEVLDHAEYMDKYVRQILKLKRRLYDDMQSIPSIMVWPTDANFILFRVHDSRQVAGELVRRGILVRDVGSEGALKNCLRVGVGTEEENRLFTAALREIVE